MNQIKALLNDLTSQLESFKAKAMSLESTIFLVKAMINLTPEKEDSEQKEFLSYKELSQFLSIPVQSLQVLVCNKEIPYYKQNGVKFKRSEILEWMLKSRIATLEETKSEYYRQ